MGREEMGNMFRLLFAEGVRGTEGKDFMLSQGDKGEAVIASELWLQLDSSSIAFLLWVYCFSTRPPPWEVQVVLKI